MRCSVVRGVLCLCVVMVALTSLSAQAATVAYWKFNEKAPGNPADIDPIENAILDETANNHDGTAYGGDEFGTGVVMPRYVAGPTTGDSALRMTLQDWPDQSSYVGDGEDVIYVPDSSQFDIDLNSGTVYTIEAIIRAPDPMTIVDSGLYNGTRQGYDEFPQWYDFTDNSIVGKPIYSYTPPTPEPSGWNLRLRGQGHIAFGAYNATTHEAAEPISAGCVTDGLWHHIAAKIITSANDNDRKVEYYIDGVKDSEGSLAGVDGTISNDGPEMIGSANDGGGEPWTQEFIGDIDAIRISTGAVTFLPAPTVTVPTMNIAHVGATNPSTETAAGFKLVDKLWTGTGETSATSTWTASGYTLASGRLQEAAESQAHYRALFMPGQIKDATGWTLTAKMKLVASNKPWNECLGVSDGQDSWVMSFMDSTFTQTSGDTGAGVYKSGEYDATQWPRSKCAYQNVEKLDAGGTLTIDPTTMFHTYQMIYDPAGDNGNGIVKFYMDGTLLGTQTRAEARNAPASDSQLGGMQSAYRFWFGDSYPMLDKYDYYVGDGASDAYWGDVKMQTGKHLAVAWDPNFDGVCGAGDLDIVRANWGLTKTANDWAHGELTGDGVVGAADLDLVRSHWGQSVPAPGIGPVPEPSTFVLLVIGSLMLLFRRRAR